MTTVTVGDLKTHFSDILKRVQLGEEVAITFGRKKEVLAYLIPKQFRDALPPRPLGLLDGKVKLEFSDNFKMTETELLGL